MVVVIVVLLYVIDFRIILCHLKRTKIIWHNDGEGESQESTSASIIGMNCSTTTTTLCSVWSGESVGNCGVLLWVIKESRNLYSTLNCFFVIINYITFMIKIKSTKKP